MKNILIILVALFITSCGSDNVGKYQKEPLPENFEHSILNEENDQNRNRVTILINKSLNDGQLATLSEEIYKMYPEAPHFYMFYVLQEDLNARVWATTHYEPEMTIQYIGFSTKQDSAAVAIANEMKNVIGRWKGEFHYYVYFEKEGKPFLRFIYNDGQVEDKPLVITTHKKGKKLTYKNNFKEYIIISDGILEQYSGQKLLSKERSF